MFVVEREYLRRDAAKNGDVAVKPITYRYTAQRPSAHGHKLRIF
jgi:hypothetical protein